MSDKLTAQQAADILGYSVRHVQRLLRLGAIKAERFNRTWIIDRHDVERVKEAQDDNGRYWHGKSVR